jgi:phosphoglycerol transferase MdoB-like AlkP superfamily enzyme
MNWSRTWAVGGFAVLAIAAIGLPLWLDPNLPGGLPWQRILLNALPLWLLALFGLGLTQRPLLSLIWTGALAGILFFVNQVKVDELREPVVFNDILLAPQLVSGFELLGSYVDNFLLLVAAIGFVGLCIAAWKWERPLFGRWSGLGLCVVSTLLLASMSSIDRPLGSLYHSQMIVPLDWEARDNVARNGLIASLARASSYILYDFPEVDPARLSRPDFLPAPPAVAPLDATDYPDIVLVLSESFFDPAVLRGVERCEYLGRYCSLEAQGQSGWLEVPTYAGNTPRSEFELLTGIPFATFGGLDYPYVSVVNRPIYAFPWYLKSLGYETTAIHTHMRSFWSRNRALPRLGIDRFIALEDIEHYERVGFWPADSVLTDQILAQFKTDGAGPPKFILAISMENHGPWNENRRSRLPEVVAEIAIPEAAGNVPAKPLQQYLFHAENVVTELERLWQFTRQRSRKTLLIFFGDHLPGLNQSFDAVGFDNGLAAFQQLTPYLVMSNFPLRSPLPETLPMHQLLVQTLGAAGLPLGETYGDLRLAFTEGRTIPNAEKKQDLDTYLRQLQITLLNLPLPSTAAVQLRPHQ